MQDKFPKANILEILLNQFNSSGIQTVHLELGRQANKGAGATPVIMG